MALQLGGAPQLAAHPGHTVEPVSVTNGGYSPSPVTIRQDSSVQWTWNNVLDESVTLDDPDESFDSGPRSQGDAAFVHTFRKPGEYTYGSTESSLTGTVIVNPYPGKPPRISRLRVVDRGGPQARFRLNKRADVVGRIQKRRAGRWRSVKSFFRLQRKGRNRMDLPAGGLKRGRYRLRLNAYDIFDRRDSAGTRFRLR